LVTIYMHPAHMHRFFHSSLVNRFSNLIMCLNIKIACSYHGETGKDRPPNEPAVIQLRFARVCIIEHHQTYKFRMLGGKISGERNDVLSLFIPTPRINLLRGSCFSSNGETWHSCGSGGPGIAYHASKRITNFSGGFRRNDLTQHHW